MVAVVLPLYQKGPYVRRALESVYGQSCLPAEVIVVNDGSTDGGDAIARDFQPPPGLVAPRVIDQPNRGVSAARNRGVAATTQPYIAFLDADDRWRSGFLARMRDLIHQYPGASLYGSGFVTVQGGVETRAYGVKPAEVISGDRSGGRVDFFRALAREPVISASSMVVPRGAFEQAGEFPEGIAHAEDFLVWAKLALAGDVVLASEPLAEYDVAVPGQAAAYWRRGYRDRFDVLAYHRFLADEMRDRGVEASDSFTSYATGQLETAALQRLYWGNLSALLAFVDELQLDTLPLSPRGRMACWIARHRSSWPAAATLVGAVRVVREAARPGRGASQS